MSDKSMLVHPKQLAEGLDNAVLFSKDKRTKDKGVSPVNDTIMVMWTEETLRFMGRGRYSACVYDVMPPDGDKPEYWDIVLDLHEAEDMAKAIRGNAEGYNAKGGEVTLTYFEPGELGVFQGEQHLATIYEIDDHKDFRASDEYEGIYEQVEKISEMPRQVEAPTSPIVWTRDVIAKLLKVKVYGNVNTDPTRLEAHWIGGATWAYRIVSDKEKAAILVMMESAIDNLEEFRESS